MSNSAISTALDSDSIQFSYPGDQIKTDAGIWRQRLLRIVKEPLLHFVILGAAIFVVTEYVEHNASQYRIVVSADTRAVLAEKYRQQYGVLPNPAQLQVLLDNHIKEEVLYREAKAIGLEDGDEIVRRRLVQKISFLNQDLALLAPPDTEQLRGWYDQHAAQYVVPKKYSFAQVYVSVDGRGEQAARREAESLLARLHVDNPERAPELGDRFPGSSDIADFDTSAVERLFGRSELAQSLDRLPQGQWYGPLRSAYGWHLVRLTGVAPERRQPFASVREQVLQDYQDWQRTTLNDRSYDEIRAKYRVETEGAL